MTRAEAGYAIRGSESKISRLELGRVSFKDRDITDLLKLYGVTDQEQVDALIALAEVANQQGWWHQYDDVLAKWFQTYLGLEEAASMIRTYEIQFVPGLFQIEDYARSLITAGTPKAPVEEIERRVQFRLQRQRKILDRENPPTIWAVVDEAALRRPIGGRGVMRRQLEYLVELNRQPTVQVQVMPFRYGVHAGEAGAYTILRFPDPEVPDVVYVEQLHSALYLDKRDQVDKYAETMNRLSAECPPPERTEAMLERILEQL